MNLLVTGGCGFIGSHFCALLAEKKHNVFVVDNLSYAANLQYLTKIPHKFFHSDIGNGQFLDFILHEYNIDGIINFAAETHVDNSINNPQQFINTNIVQTSILLQSALKHQKNKPNFKFVHISTDEVFGDLDFNDPKFTEQTQYNPSSPYSASKAASDHLVKAWVKTYKLNAIVTNCTNNFGPHQHVEKLIPKVISLCMQNKPITIYGTGKNIRDWIYVMDHCNGIYLALQNGKIGESYCFGGNMELSNIDIVHKICAIMDKIKPISVPYKNNIIFVSDRAGHDLRYAIDDGKAVAELNYKRIGSFEQNLQHTLEWYVTHIQNV